MVAAAKTAAALQAKAGTRKQQDRIHAAATAAQTNAAELISQARESDMRTAQEARADLDQVRAEHQAVTSEVTELHTDQQHRNDHPDPAADHARQHAYAAEQARAAAEELDAADTYGADPYTYDPTQQITEIPDSSFER